MIPRWWALSRGDLDTTLVQVGFNLAQMVIPVFLLLPVGDPGRIQRGAPLARLRAGIPHRLARSGRYGGKSRQTRKANRCNRPRLRKQRTGDHRLHAFDHAAGLPSNPRCQSGLGNRRGSRGLDGDDQACSRAFREGHPPHHSRPRRHDGIRRGHVQLSRSGSVAARLRSARGRSGSARDHSHHRSCRRSHYNIPHSTFPGRLDRPAGGRRWPSVTYTPSGRVCRRPSRGRRRPNPCAPCRSLCPTSR